MAARAAAAMVEALVGLAVVARLAGAVSIHLVVPDSKEDLVVTALYTAVPGEEMAAKGASVVAAVGLEKDT